MHSIIFSKRAKRDLEDILDFISLDNDYFWNKVTETIIVFINHNLCYFPLLWKPFENKNLREILEPTFKYRIIYTFSNDQIEIIAIFKHKNFI